MRMGVDRECENGSLHDRVEVSFMPEEMFTSGGNHMRALIRATQKLARPRLLHELFEIIMEASIEAVAAERGMVITIEGGEVQVRASRGNRFEIATTVLNRVLEEKEPLLVRDVLVDRTLREDARIIDQKVRSFIAVPLQTVDRFRVVIGLIYLDTPNLHEFSRDDLKLLTTLANVASIRLEYSRRNEVEQA